MNLRLSLSIILGNNNNNPRARQKSSKKSNRFVRSEPVAADVIARREESFTRKRSMRASHPYSSFELIDDATAAFQ